ncbi:MAG: hypothetical protein CMM87_06800 [Rickettsiales bacterium]|nr:hypothetical protein [Rickettsiales bacterium]
MTDSLRDIVDRTLLMFARKHGWEHLNQEEQERARCAESKQTHSRYMHLYAQSTPTSVQINREERSQSTA